MKTTFDFTENGSFEVNKDGRMWVKDSNENIVYVKDSKGTELWWNGNSDITIHSKNSKGVEAWYNDEGNKITQEEFDYVHSV